MLDDITIVFPAKTNCSSDFNSLPDSFEQILKIFVGPIAEVESY